MQYSIYLNNDSGSGIADYYCGKNIYLLVHIEDVPFDEQVSNLIQQLGEYLEQNPVNHLTDLEEAIEKGIKKYNLPPSLSLAAGYVQGEVLYVKTLGNAQIFIKRDKQFVKLIEGDESASGYMKVRDIYAFTTTHFTSQVSPGVLQEVLAISGVRTINQVLTPKIHNAFNQNVITLFLAYQSSLSLTEPSIHELPQPGHVYSLPQEKTQNKGWFSDAGALRTFLSRIHSGENKKSTFTVIIVGAIAIVLIWSVVLGYNRRLQAQHMKKIQTAREIITQKLTQSEEVAFLNASRSQALIIEAKTELETLKSILGTQYKKEIEDLEQLIKAKEEQVVRKEEKNAEEFYDLTLDNKKAKGDKLGISDDTMIILDKANGVLYVLSLSKKSLDKRTISAVRAAELVGVYETNLFYFIPSEGLYQVEEEKSAKKVIESDSEWGSITDLTLFNKMLDPNKNQIYKYLVAENGYSSKSAYFKTNDVSITDAHSFAIDSSVYVGLPERILKFTSGLIDGFQTEFPEEDVMLSKVMTDKESEKLYAWDKKKGVIYVLSKNGSYERQVKSALLTKAKDIVTHGENAYLLISEKIYRLSLE